MKEDEEMEVAMMRIMLSIEDGSGDKIMVKVP